jgi:hypothetical protein
MGKTNGFPIPDLCYTLQPESGVYGNRKFLSTTGDGLIVSLYHEVDPINPKRQYWSFTPMGDDLYEIHVAGNVVPKERRFLSTVADGSKVDLYTKNDGSGRQLWKLTQVGDNLFNIQIANGVNNKRTFLSTNGDGSVVDLWFSDDDSGRQRWTLMPEDAELIELKADMSTQTVTAPPEFMQIVELVNHSSIDQSMVAHFSKRAEEMSSFAQEYSIGMTISSTTGIGAKIGVAEVEQSFTFELSANAAWTYGKNETKEDTRAYDFPVVVPPHTKVRATVKVSQQKADVPYVATFKSRKTHKEIPIKGIWRGVLLGDITTDYEMIALEDAKAK